MTTPYTPPVDQLLKLGRPEGPWLDYPSMGLSLADVPALIRLMQDDDLRFMEEPEDWPHDEDLPEWYAGIHAWRARPTQSRRSHPGQPGAAERYLDFLKSGSSRYPLEALQHWLASI